MRVLSDYNHRIKLSLWLGHLHDPPPPPPAVSLVGDQLTLPVHEVITQTPIFHKSIENRVFSLISPPRHQIRVVLSARLGAFGKAAHASGEQNK